MPALSPSVTQLLSKEAENGFSCAECGRSFENPLQVTNRSLKPEESYPACPFCFTRSETLNEALERGPSHLPNKPDLSSKETEKVPESMQDEDSEKEIPKDCPQFYGYLKTRPKGESFSDTCLTCRKMLECLMK